MTVSHRNETTLLIVIVCYRAADLTIDCLRSLAPEVNTVPGTKVAICENGTGEESARQIADAIEREGWDDWAELTVISPNRGFPGGNNVVLREVLAAPRPPTYFLLLNADTIVRPGALATLVAAAEENPEAGIIGPRLEWPDGTPQHSCFRDYAPTHELLVAARTSVLDSLIRADEHVLPVSDLPLECDWICFACALIRHDVFHQVGILDEGYHLYFDDPDFCRRARHAGWKVLHWPAAHIVHLQGQSNPVVSQTAQLKRRSSYWYASRARYYAKYYGRSGVWKANLLWTAGRSISLAREILGNKRPHTCEKEWLDIWTNWRDPLRVDHENTI